MLKVAFRVAYGLLGDYQIEGADNVPPAGPLLVINNHLSIADPPLILIGVPRKLSGFVAEKYRKNPFFRWLTQTVGGIWIRQSEADLAALREALAYFKAGGVLGIAVEGTRSKTHGLIKGKPGAAYLADRANVPILPVACMGTDLIGDRFRKFRRAKLKLRIGRPFRLPANGRAKSGTLDEYTDLIMCHLAALLPEHYRGVYADHPRLHEAVAHQSGAGESVPAGYDVVGQEGGVGR